jgi:D-alanyl-D-alanine carboxypeptidase (penicillin-binding protein 5/6)
MTRRRLVKRYIKLSFRRIRSNIWLFLALIVVLILFFSLILHDSTPVIRPVRPSPLPISQKLPPPDISALHVFALDLDSRLVLYQKDADTRTYPASTTKMVTGIVAMENYSLDQPVLVSREFTDGQRLGLKTGETLSLEKLLFVMLVQSANDAAEIIADQFPGGREEFISQMNNAVALWNLQNTHFQNPTGLDQDGHYSSASDLVRIAEKFISYPELRRISSTENAVISSSDSSNSYIVSNINQLLGKVPGVLGIKTGFTDGAGQALVTLVNRNGHPVIISVINSADRFSDTEILINWIYLNFSWPESLPAGNSGQPLVHTP